MVMCAAALVRPEETNLSRFPKLPSCFFLPPWLDPSCSPPPPRHFLVEPEARGSASPFSVAGRRPPRPSTAAIMAAPPSTAPQSRSRHCHPNELGVPSRGSSPRLPNPVPRGSRPSPDPGGDGTSDGPSRGARATGRARGGAARDSGAPAGAAARDAGAPTWLLPGTSRGTPPRRR